jgi:ABC-type antimicrobial peptide transport system permease subunit
MPVHLESREKQQDRQDVKGETSAELWKSSTRKSEMYEKGIRKFTVGEEVGEHILYNLFILAVSAFECMYRGLLAPLTTNRVISSISLLEPQAPLSGH